MFSLVPRYLILQEEVSINDHSLGSCKDENLCNTQRSDLLPKAVMRHSLTLRKMGGWESYGLLHRALEGM